MEYALRELTVAKVQRFYCLNPCFNGICSQRRLALLTAKTRRAVLILVLMEYALRAPDEVDWLKRIFVLILVLMEYALRVRGSACYRVCR